jgi:hypothetical protein
MVDFQAGTFVLCDRRFGLEKTLLLLHKFNQAWVVVILLGVGDGKSENERNEGQHDEALYAVEADGRRQLD